MARRRWTRGRILAYSVLLAVVMSTLLIGGKEYAELFRFTGVPGKDLKDDKPPVKRILDGPAELARVRAIVDADRDSWQSGGLVQKGSGSDAGFYEAVILNASGREVFRLKLSPTGVPFAGGKPPAYGRAVSEEELDKLLLASLSRLVIGDVRAAGKDGRDRDVGLTYDRAEVARVKIDGARQAVDVKKLKRAGWLFDEKQMRGSGWGATAALILALLYWPCKRLRFFAPTRMGGRPL